jgi:prepilin-type N-terminal cleavage/methylation domain-containing protein
MRMIKDERGMTLPELLVTMVIAMILSLATFSLIDVVMKRSGEVSARVDTVQRGRTAMDQLTRALRSQVCALRSDNATMSTPRSIEAATATSVSVYADFSSETLVSGVVPPPGLRTYSLTDGILAEDVIKGSPSGAKVSYTYGGAVKTTRPMIKNLALYKPAGATDPIPMFRYYAFNSATPPRPDQLLATDRALTPTELGTVARISISFRVLTFNGSEKGSTVLQDDVYVRTADPNAPTPKPTCLTT